MSTQNTSHQTATAVPAPPIRDLVARVEQEKIPVNIGRRLFSVVTGVAALATGTLTGATVYLWLTERGSSPVFELPIVVVLAATTWGFGFLTWRWARSLPRRRHSRSPSESGTS